MCVSAVPLKVLLVEDDRPTLEMMTEVLASQGAEVRAFDDSQQAETYVQQEKFDGIFLDLLMPKLDGFTLARKIRASTENRHTPIVIITGLTDKRTMERAFAAGATFFLEKPIDRQTLTRLFHRAWGSMLEEKRRFERVPVCFEVSCWKGARTITGISFNLSEGGIWFQGDGSIQPGDRAELSFRLPRQRMITHVTGVVVRVDEERRVGVEFTHVSLRDRQRIRRLVTELLDFNSLRAGVSNQNPPSA